MAIEIKEEFEIEAPIARVWEFMMTPEKVVPCIPGASLAEVIDDRNFLGKVKVKLGAVSAAFKGKIHFADVDNDKHVLQMVAEGKDPSGGTAKGTITCSLTTAASGHTQLTTDAQVDITGKVMQVGRGMIQGVSKQLFLQFSKNIKSRLGDEIAAASTAEGTSSQAEGAAGFAAPTAAAAIPAPVEEAELKVLPLLLKTLAAAIANFFKRIFGGAK
jgi:carbon monoxide dehydrogenase subunit G